MPLPIRGTFHYQLPKGMAPAPGCRVRVPFHRRQLVGMVVGLTRDPQPFKTKPIDGVLDSEPVLTPDLLEAARGLARRTQAAWGEVLFSALPGYLRRGKPADTAPRSRIPESEEQPDRTTPLTLTAAQQRAFETIREAIRAERHQVFLLHGVTGSGKTEVYLQAIQEVFAAGKDSILLVPEISLTPQTIERFRGRFGHEAVAVLHSRMLESHRLMHWQRIRSGQARVVIGARSAVFAPVRRLGLIVVDEEHEPSYKQADAPRYHARQAAILRAGQAGAPVLLGSATPALESYNDALRGRAILLELPERIDRIPMPEVTIVDMRRQTGRRRLFSERLTEAIKQTLKKGEQGILFLNRRGFATVIQCGRCGQTAVCPACDHALTYHSGRQKLVCHPCHRLEPVPTLCPKCRGDYVRFRGMGTERVESELIRLFPGARISRMDTDATQARASHDRILKAFGRHEIDLLVGTQMIAKGLDFPRVTLVGVINADTALNLPDFRSAERTFQLLTQVGGRAGRAQLPGQVVIQTHTPHHPAILAAQAHDFKTFYLKEIVVRKEVGLPPFTALVHWTVKSLSATKAEAQAQTLAEQLRETMPETVRLLGPAPAPIPRLRRQSLWQIALTAPKPEILEAFLSGFLEKHRPTKGVRWIVDVDPL